MKVTAFVVNLLCAILGSSAAAAAADAPPKPGLIDCDIAEYPQANLMNHVAKRTRKLLLRKRELEKVAEAATHKGLTLVPLAVYFSRGFVKVRLAVAKGRKLHDKREVLRRKEDAREMRNATLRRR